MKWSKLKKIAEGLLADSLQGHVHYHTTRYHISSGGHENHGRAWITFDGEELCSFSEVAWETERDRLTSELRRLNRAEDYREPEQSEEYYRAYEEAGRILELRGLYSRAHFTSALYHYVNMPLEEALTSDDPLLRALAMFDRRVGKRRLRRLIFTGDRFDLARRFHLIRCEAEGIAPDTLSR